MTQDNPFESPVSDKPPEVPSGEGPVTPAVLAALRQTRPWVLFLAVLGFLAVALLICLGGAFLVGGGLLPAQPGQPLPLPALGAVYLVLGLIYVLPPVYLWRYGTSISALLRSGAVTDLETALLRQRSFWRFVGILTAAILCLYLVIIVVGAIAIIIMTPPIKP